MGPKLFENYSGNYEIEAVRSISKLMINLDKSKTINEAVLSRNVFAKERALNFKEKVGDFGRITSLFYSGLAQNPNFMGEAKYEVICPHCSKHQERIESMGPLFNITTDILVANIGNCCQSLLSKFTDYLIDCCECFQQITVKKSITIYPKFLTVVLDYADDLNGGKQVKLSSLKIDNIINLLGYQYTLKSIVYFPPGHYSVHILGVSHPTLISNEQTGWFFHDDLMNNGDMYESDPVLEISFKNTARRPYILLYENII